MINETEMRMLPVKWFDELPSTNTYLLEKLALCPDLPQGYSIAARKQTCGRGRLNRTWLSNEHNLAFSFVLRPEAEPSRLPSLPMGIGIAVHETIHNLGVDARLKWPNDVMARGRKICGVLVEWITTAKIIRPVAVVGIGLNVNMSEKDTQQIDQPTTSLLIETSQVFTPEDVLCMLQPTIENWINNWVKGGYTTLRSYWERYTDPLGSRILVRQPTGIVQGELAGFGAQGQMILRTEDGQTQTIFVGDVSRAI